jgi:hypothetical protein
MGLRELAYPPKSWDGSGPNACYPAPAFRKQRFLLVGQSGRWVSAVNLLALIRDWPDCRLVWVAIAGREGKEKGQTFCKLLSFSLAAEPEP